MRKTASLAEPTKANLVKHIIPIQASKRLQRKESSLLKK